MSVALTSLGETHYYHESCPHSCKRSRDIGCHRAMGRVTFPVLPRLIPEPGWRRTAAALARTIHQNGTRADWVAFGEYLERHRRALVSVALDRVGRPDVAEDIAQQAIAKAWEHRESLREREAPAGWLFRITVNCCVEWQRRDARSLASLRDSPAAEPSVLEEVIRRETIREARRALLSVPVRNRIAFLMHVSGYSYGDIAGFLGVPPSAVRGRVARARSHLRKHLARRLGRALHGKEMDGDGSA